MDFRKKTEKPPANASRWGNLNNDNGNNEDNNVFHTVQRRGGRNRRQQDTAQARDREKLSGTMPLPGIEPPVEKKTGKYVAPGKRSRDNTPPRQQGLSLTRKKPPPKAPDRNDATAYPTLGGVIVPEVDKEDVEEEKTSFADLLTATEVKPKQEKVYKDDIKPGWVRLSRGPNGQIMREYGPEVPKSQFWINWERAEEQRKRQDLIDTLERHREYARWAYPYENWYEPSDDEDECDDGCVEEWVSDEDY